jgi:hypothetical protein
MANAGTAIHADSSMLGEYAVRSLDMYLLGCCECLFKMQIDAWAQEYLVVLST